MQIENFSLKYKPLLEFLEKNIKHFPRSAVVLGSGLGNFADRFKILQSFSFKEMPCFPSATIVGHQGIMLIVKIANNPILLFQGRIHLYEGNSLSDTLLPVYISYILGCKNIILTNAAGGVNQNFSPGDLMLINSFIAPPLKKKLSELLYPPPFEMKEKYYNLPGNELNKIIKTTALKNQIDLKEGTYWYSTGPCYETPSEVRMIGKFGGDAVGMSTAHEAFFAASLKMQIGAISCITNHAAGISQKKLSHSEVTETATAVKNKFETLLEKTIEAILAVAEIK